VTSPSATTETDSREVADDRLTALVTGAATGIGAAVAVELGRIGSQVVLADLPGRDLTAVAESVRDAGGEALPAQADVRSFDDMAEVTRTAVARFGRLDVLVANAGITERSSVADGDPDRWRAVVETNLLGAAYSIRAVLPHMLERGRGHVVINASTASREVYVGEPMYLASKWGILGFGQVVRRELETSPVRVTIIQPDVVDTALTRSIPDLEPRLEEEKALRPEDVARMVVFAVTQPAHVAVNEILLRPQFPPVQSSLGSRIRRKARRTLGSS
jgi:NADP-dependent 3-hydroxy acid dehydrogenase YdfG